MLFATDIDPDGRKSVVTGSVFRFCSFNGKPATEIYQPVGMSGFVEDERPYIHSRTGSNLERVMCNRFRDAGKRLLRPLAAAFPYAPALAKFFRRRAACC